jgi:hypothetical protein
VEDFDKNDFFGEPELFEVLFFGLGDRLNLTGNHG